MSFQAKCFPKVLLCSLKKLNEDHEIHFLCKKLFEYWFSYFFRIRPWCEECLCKQETKSLENGIYTTPSAFAYRDEKSTMGNWRMPYFPLNVIDDKSYAKRLQYNKVEYLLRLTYKNSMDTFGSNGNLIQHEDPYQIRRNIQIPMWKK